LKKYLGAGISVILAFSALSFVPQVASAKSLSAAGAVCTIVGTAGNDRLRGTAGNDVICGLGGNDIISGLGGNDTIDGGKGNDTIDGGAGNDVLIGGAGNDKLVGGSGSDIASFIDTASSVNATLIGKSAKGDGSDSLSAIESLTGGSGNDSLTGDASSNTLSGGAGSDILRGGSGNDTLLGGLGNDTLAGDTGTDVVSFTGNSTGVQADLSLGTSAGEGVDTISGAEGLSGGSGDDILVGNSDSNLISGGSGNDLIEGGDGADSIFGDLGADTLIGDGGNDNLIGDLGDDNLEGGLGADNLNGGEGVNQCVADASDVSAACRNDNTPPTISSIVLMDGLAHDSQTGDHTMTIKVTISENFGVFVVGVGFSGISFLVDNRFYDPPACPPGAQEAPARFSNKLDGTCLLSGTRYAGTYLITKDTNLSNEPANNFRPWGINAFSGANASDQFNNPSSYNASDFNPGSTNLLPIDSLLDYVNDATAPNVTSVSLTSEPESGTGQHLRIRASFTDSESGLRSLGVSFKSGNKEFGVSTGSTLRSCIGGQAPDSGPAPLGAQYFILSETACLISGDRNAGTVEFTITLPRWLDSGTYRLSNAGGSDMMQNTIPFPNVSLPQSDVFIREPVVLLPNEDYLPPIVDSVTVASDSIDVSSNAAYVQVEFHFTDLTGLTFGGVNFSTPTGGQIFPQFGNLSPCSETNTGAPREHDVSGCIVSGNATDGVIRLLVKVAAHSPTGVYRLMLVLAGDGFENVKSYSAEGQFTVTG
jgi:Ca2+-binding RTX toxin-like protein